jgi:hypothetical protein
VQAVEHLDGVLHVLDDVEEDSGVERATRCEKLGRGFALDVETAR